MDTIKTQREILQKEVQRRQRINQLTHELCFIRNQLTKVYLSVIQQQNERADYNDKN